MCVIQETSGLLEVVPTWKGEWKCALEPTGGQCVMISGSKQIMAKTMQIWPASSWAFLIKAKKIPLNYSYRDNRYNSCAVVYFCAIFTK